MSNPIEQARNLIAALGAISPVQPADPVPPECQAFPFAARLALPHAALAGMTTREPDEVG